MPPLYSDHPTVSHNLNEFTARATRLLESEEYDPFINFVLTGEYLDDGALKQAFLDPIQNLVPVDHPLRISRDYDSVIGFSEDILVEGPVSVRAVPHPTFALTKSIHMARAIRYEGVSS